MKPETAVAIINTSMWIGVSAAIIFALYITKSASVLWFFLIPSFFGMATRGGNSTKNFEKDQD